MRPLASFSFIMMDSAPLGLAFQPKSLRSSRWFPATTSGVQTCRFAGVNNAQEPSPGLGGIQNFVGLLASFDASTGVLVPLPDYYVPSAMKEWGQVPSVLEVLTSSGGSHDRLQTIVLPETGCGIDNLETIMAKETIKPLAVQHGGLPGSLAALVTRSKASTVEYFEATFPHEIAEDEKSNKYRCRVSFPIGSDSKRIKMVIERFIEEDDGSSNKMVAEITGGGLDGQSVARWLGPQLNSGKWRAFAESTRPSSATGSKVSLSLPLGVSVHRDAQFVTISKTGDPEHIVSLDLNTLTLHDVSLVGVQT
jgi:hypothetical protein